MCWINTSIHFNLWTIVILFIYLLVISTYNYQLNNTYFIVKGLIILPAPSLHNHYHVLSYKISNIRYRVRKDIQIYILFCNNYSCRWVWIFISSLALHYNSWTQLIFMILPFYSRVRNCYLMEYAQICISAYKLEFQNNEKIKPILWIYYHLHTGIYNDVWIRQPVSDS